MKSSNGDIEGRLYRAESSVEGLRAELQNVQSRVQELATRSGTDTEKLGTQLGAQVNALRKELEDARRPNWQLWVSAALLLAGVWGYAMRPMQQAADAAERRLAHVENWQESYMLGNVPSPKLAEMAQKFSEIETQFHAFKERMIENEGYTKERADRNEHRIDDAISRAETLSTETARLDERARNGHIQ